MKLAPRLKPHTLTVRHSRAFPARFFARSTRPLGLVTDAALVSGMGLRGRTGIWPDRDDADARHPTGRRLVRAIPNSIEHFVSDEGHISPIFARSSPCLPQRPADENEGI
jgi:hypothetical protein